MDADNALPRPTSLTHPDLPNITIPRTTDVEAWINLAICGDVPWKHTIVTSNPSPHATGLLIHIGPEYNTCAAAAFTDRGTWLYTTFSPGASIYCPRASDGVTATHAAHLVGVQVEIDAGMNSWMAYRLNTHQWTRSHAEQDRITRLNGWIEEGHQYLLRIRALEILAENHPDEFATLWNSARVQRALSQHPSTFP